MHVVLQVCPPYAKVTLISNKCGVECVHCVVNVSDVISDAMDSRYPQEVITKHRFHAQYADERKQVPSGMMHGLNSNVLQRVRKRVTSGGGSQWI